MPALTILELRTACDYAALVVANHGEAYLPVFLRLEEELVRAEAGTSALERARAIANKNSPLKQPAKAA